MHFCFVSTHRGSYFMTELLGAISAATAAVGHSVELVFDKFPRLRDQCVYVVIPHEFRAWGIPAGFPTPQQRERTIALCTENLGTEWFEATYELLPEFAAAVAINRSSADELRRRGIRCEHLQLGYSPLWDSWLGDSGVERDIDVLYLGAEDPRRDPLLAGFGRDLWARECQFLVPPLEPRTAPRPDFLMEGDKYNRLRSAKILLNLHRTTSSALEWMRFLEAICNGCVVVSEPCLDGTPLVAGEHFVEAHARDIGRIADRLLDEPQRLRRLQEHAYDFVRRELPMEPAGRRLAELAAELPQRPIGAVEYPAAASSHAPTPAVPEPPAPREAPAARARRSEAAQSAAADDVGPQLGPLRRIYSRARRFRRGGLCDAQILCETPAYAGARPRVSIAVVLRCVHDAAGVSKALASVAASQAVAFEVLLNQDASCVPSGLAARHFLEKHPSLPGMLVQQPVNHGVGQSRNDLIARARGEYVFILEDNGGIYPSALGRLLRALEADRHATFSYPMVAGFAGEQPVELLSSLPWEPERLKTSSWIDPMTLLRRTLLIELGGYSTDPDLAGWEHFDLWCKCAAAGGYGVLVPQVLAWHRSTPNSALPPELWERMHARYPQLLGSPA